MRTALCVRFTQSAVALEGCAHAAPSSDGRPEDPIRLLLGFTGQQAEPKRCNEHHGMTKKAALPADAERRPRREGGLRFTLINRPGHRA